MIALTSYFHSLAKASIASKIDRQENGETIRPTWNNQPWQQKVVPSVLLVCPCYFVNVVHNVVFVCGV